MVDFRNVDFIRSITTDKAPDGIEEPNDTKNYTIYSSASTINTNYTRDMNSIEAAKDGEDKVISINGNNIKIDLNLSDKVAILNGDKDWRNNENRMEKVKLRYEEIIGKIREAGVQALSI